MSAIHPLERARSQWAHRGERRPPFALAPGEGQESVWDYPRPPACVPDGRRVRITFAGETVADTQAAVRVLETASPPAFYVPPDDVVRALLEPASGSSLCEWKGQARYWTVRVGGKVAPSAAWSYDAPFEPFAPYAGWLAFYPAKVDCEVGGARVEAQSGGFYGGWVTPEIVGPFKGEPGTSGW